MAHLRRGGLRVKVETAGRFRAGSFRAALDQPWDIVILSDFNVPGFSEPGCALEIVKASSDRPLPFILISGEIGEDVAVAAMRNGASDYLLKANLARLAPAVEHAIDAHEAMPSLAREQGRPAARAVAPAPVRARAAFTRPASTTSAPRSRARSTTTSAARSRR